jgi:hypothetical protein
LSVSPFSTLKCRDAATEAVIPYGFERFAIFNVEMPDMNGNGVKRQPPGTMFRQENTMPLCTAEQAISEPISPFPGFRWTVRNG